MPVHTPEELAAQLGEQLRALRLRQNLDQRQLAARAGIALNAVKNLESGHGGTVRSLLKVLRTLDRLDWLSALSPQVSISPLQALKRRPARRRVSRPRTTRGE
jgi:transcriptional regulator with XRE-family HTH domain